MLEPRQHDVPTSRCTLDAWGAGVAIGTCDGLWFEALAPLGCDDVARLAALLAATREDAVLDLRAAGPSALGLGVAQQILTWRSAAWWEARRRIQLVARDGIAQAIAAGLALALAPVLTHAAAPDVAAPGRARLARTAAPALAAPRALVAPWAAVRRAVIARPDADLATVAAALGTTRRALQRRLADCGTSYREEQGRTVLELAHERVVASHTKLAAIACELGFASESQLSRAFRRRFGASPQTLRADRP